MESYTRSHCRLNGLTHLKRIKEQQKTGKRSNKRFLSSFKGSSALPYGNTVYWRIRSKPISSLKEGAALNIHVNTKNQEISKLQLEENSEHLIHLKYHFISTAIPQKASGCWLTNSVPFRANYGKCHHWYWQGDREAQCRNRRTWRQGIWQ